MRSLNTSLPGTSPPKQQPQQGGEPPEQLLQAFKAAALSVTKLYKTAALDQTRARSEGYQDALDDLLSFLDKEDIGLSDGEGWKIRRWATERLDGRDSVSQNNESDDETVQPERGSSPVLRRTPSINRLSTRTASPARMETSAPPPSIPTTILEHAPTPMLPPTSTFTFRSSHAYPQDTDMNSSDIESSDRERAQSLDATVVPHPPHTPAAAITISRPGRSASRHNSQANRHNSRTTSNIGRGAGQKRKINLGDFFDISNLGHGKDGLGGGGKRGRFI